MPLEPVMTPEELRKRTKTFAIDVIRFCRRLPRTDEARVISWQLLRAGTGVGANYRAVFRFRSDKDFISKLGVVIEEADEAAFWLELLSDAGIVTAATTKNLYREADELTRIFVTSRETARCNRRAKLRGRTTKSRTVTS
jgi:four helix bundle protein